MAFDKGSNQGARCPHETLRLATLHGTTLLQRCIGTDGGKSNVEIPAQISSVEFYAVDTAKGHGPRGSQGAFAVRMGTASIRWSTPQL